MSLMAGVQEGHDRAASPPDRAATATLTRAVSGLRLHGAIFLRGVYTEAWAYESIPAADATAVLAPGEERIVLFHVVASGRAWIETDDSERHWAGTGDVIVLPYGDTHRMGGCEAAEPTPMASLLEVPPWREMPVVHHGAGGAETHIVCGYLACRDPLFDPRLRALPSVFVVSPPQGPARDWVQASIEYAAQQTVLVSDRHFEAPTQVAELLLVEMLKLHLASAPAAESGWVAALRDPVLAPALAAVHGSPERKWTLIDLAHTAHVSVSLLDERFREALGLSPIRYLAEWRMHVAQDLLRSTELGVAAVAHRVGYDAEEAFSRAFKRTYGVPPSAARN